MTRHPNVALVVLDTARAADTPPSRADTMPTLAALAAEGTVYERAFATAPWTVPSHASLFTGTYPSCHGTHGDHTYLAEGHRLLAESFADSGYETIGVSNNTWVTEEFGFARGFETFWKGWQYWQSDADMGTVARADEPAEKLRRAAAHLFDGNPLVNAVNVAYSELLQPAGDDGAARTTDRIEGWLADRDDDRPFFLFANYIEPHVRYRPPREHAEPFLPADATYEEATEIRQDPRAYDVGEYELTERDCRLLAALYRGELSYVDSQLQRLRAALREAGEWEDTLLVVVGDHGENVGDHGFLGHQYNLYDTVLHVPLVLTGGAFSREAGGTGDAGGNGGTTDAAETGTGETGTGEAGKAGGTIRGDLVQLSDLVPTLLDATGVSDPELREQCRGQARSFHPELSTDAGRDAVYAEYVAPQPSMARLEERFGHVPEHVREYDRSLRVIRTDRWKLVSGSDGHEELYDVRADPDEATDLSADRPERASQLRSRLETWHDSLDHAEATGEVSMSAETEQRLQNLGYL